MNSVETPGNWSHGRGTALGLSAGNKALTDLHECSKASKKLFMVFYLYR